MRSAATAIRSCLPEAQPCRRCRPRVRTTSSVCHREVPLPSRALHDRTALLLQGPLRESLSHRLHVWGAESRLVRDAIVPMAAYGATTERIKIGSGVINNWTRNAALIAATFSTLDDLAPGRMMCGQLFI